MQITKLNQDNLAKNQTIIDLNKTLPNKDQKLKNSEVKIYSKGSDNEKLNDYIKKLEKENNNLKTQIKYGKVEVKKITSIKEAAKILFEEQPYEKYPNLSENAKKILYNLHEAIDYIKYHPEMDLAGEGGLSFDGFDLYS